MKVNLSTLDLCFAFLPINLMIFVTNLAKSRRNGLPENRLIIGKALQVVLARHLLREVENRERIKKLYFEIQTIFVKSDLLYQINDDMQLLLNSKRVIQSYLFC